MLKEKRHLSEKENDLSYEPFCVATIQGMEQVINSIDAFVGDTILQGKTYDTGKTFFAQTF
ncbi:cytoplasmic protein, partial [Bacillus thuringiensis]|nr:cytoplasmic protein [Bacillus thuringiensis]